MQRAVFAVLALLMAVFAVLQVNDPDPTLWVLLYLIGAGVLAAAALGRSHRAVTLVVMAVMALFAMRAAPGVLQWAFEHDFESITGAMSDDKPWIEETREFLGLLIALACLGVLALWPLGDADQGADS